MKKIKINKTDYHWRIPTEEAYSRACSTCTSNRFARCTRSQRAERCPSTCRDSWRTDRRRQTASCPPAEWPLPCCRTGHVSHWSAPTFASSRKFPQTAVAPSLRAGRPWRQWSRCYAFASASHTESCSGQSWFPSQLNKKKSNQHIHYQQLQTPAYVQIRIKVLRWSRAHPEVPLVKGWVGGDVVAEMNGK